MPGMGTPRECRCRHGRTLADIGPAQWRGIELVQHIFQSDIETDLFPFIAAAQIQQTVAAGLNLVADLRHVCLGANQLFFNGVGPVPRL